MLDSCNRERRHCRHCNWQTIILFWNTILRTKANEVTERLNLKTFAHTSIARVSPRKVVSVAPKKYKGGADKRG